MFTGLHNYCMLNSSANSSASHNQSGLSPAIHTPHIPQHPLWFSLNRWHTQACLLQACNACSLSRLSQHHAVSAPSVLWDAQGRLLFHPGSYRWCESVAQTEWLTSTINAQFCKPLVKIIVLSKKRWMELDNRWSTCAGIFLNAHYRTVSPKYEPNSVLETEMPSWLKCSDLLSLCYILLFKNFFNLIYSKPISNELLRRQVCISDCLARHWPGYHGVLGVFTGCSIIRLLSKKNSLAGVILRTCRVREDTPTTYHTSCGTSKFK